MRSLRLALFLLGCLFAAPAWADADRCVSCGELISGKFYQVTDKVTDAKVPVCPECETNCNRCFVCGVPAKTGFTPIPDGRIICARDAKTAVLDDDNAQQLCLETRTALNRLLSRFLSFPEDRVTTKLVDVVDLDKLFKAPGHNRACQNIWGCTETEVSRAGFLSHHVSLLSGLPTARFKATCAHEYTHCWLNERLPRARKKSLDGDAVEGFCELIPYLVAQAAGDTEEMKLIKLNHYTKGQVDLFVDTERQYGLSDVIDWMQYGVDARLKADELGAIRKVDMPASARRQPNHPVLYSSSPPPAPAPDTLVLKGISGTRARPFALINDHTFEPNEQSKVRVGNTNLLVRCLSIHGDTVRVLLVDSGRTQDLKLKPEGHP